jgi:hypothetical protein
MVASVIVTDLVVKDRVRRLNAKSRKLLFLKRGASLQVRNVLSTDQILTIQLVASHIRKNNHL